MAIALGLEKFEKLDKRVIKCKICVSMNRSKTTSLLPNLDNGVVFQV